MAGDLGTGIHIRFEDAASLQKVVPRDPFVALKRVPRNFRLRFEMDSSRQFAQRLVNDLESILGAGFEMNIGQKRYGTNRYTTRRLG